MHKGIEIGRFSNFQFPNEKRQNNSLCVAETVSQAIGQGGLRSPPAIVVPERKFAKIQSIVFYGLDGYFWTLIITSNTKN
jgi:hypothetical protein